MSRQLAIAVIPNEYGIDPPSKLRIGSRIATEVRALFIALLIILLTLCCFILLLMRCQGLLEVAFLVGN